MFDHRPVIACFLALSVGVAAAPLDSPSPRKLEFVVEEATIAQVHAAFQNGSLTCRHLVDTYLARIEKYDKAGPALNAIASLNPNAVSEADRLDRLFGEQGLTGPLHCVPVIVKDNIETQGWETTAGSVALKGFIPARDATAITKLKAAGAIILAKASMSDLALNALTTVNLIQGRTKNPYALDRVPGGSSGGVAVAVAANFGLVGIGTDTGNSIRGPAAHAGIVGVRPTIGLTSRTGTVPLDVRSDVVGPLARTVEDAAAVLDVLVGWDPADSATEAIRQLPTSPEVQGAMDRGLSGLRVGVFRQAYEGGPLKTDDQVTKAFARVVSDLRSLGVEVVESVSIPEVKSVPEAERCQGLKYDLDEYLERQGPLVPVHSLEAIVASGQYEPSIQQDIVAMADSPQQGPGSSACEANAAYRLAMAGALMSTLARERIDALIYPTWSQLPQLTSHIDAAEAGQSLRFSTASGFPSLTVPMGFSEEGLPLGVSFLGRAFGEAQLLRLAYGYEQATRYRRPPVIAPPIF